MSNRDRARGAWSGALVLALFALACSRSPDVVATKTAKASAPDAGGFTGIMMFEPCKAGKYYGSMVSIPNQFFGVINFALVETRSGEIAVLSDTSLLNGTGQNGSTFTATIPGGGQCVDGQFHTTLEDGKYQVSPGSSTIAFEGTIDGSYDAHFNGFIGTWKSELHLVPNNDAAVIGVQGKWSASWYMDNN